MSTIREVLNVGIDKLNTANIDNPRYDGRILLEYVLKCDRNYILIYGDNHVDSEDVETYLELINRRCTHFPLQYILGYQEFMGYEYKVNSNVLIPRQDTEILVEEVLKYVKTDNSILDMCCGSGCIGISIYKYFKDFMCTHNGELSNIQVDLADISLGAISVATENSNNLQANVDIIESDIYSNITQKYNIIISNPPYIRSDVIPTLMEEVKEYEPMMALDGMEDGLYFYRKIIGGARRYLYEQGYVFLEIGCDQATYIREIFVDNQFKDITVIKDLAGLDRVVYAHI